MGADVRPGGRKCRLQFHRAERLDDGYQERLGPYTPFGSAVWAQQQVIRDAERYAAGTVGVEAVARFVVRYSAFTVGITHDDRLLCDGRTYAIAGIKEIGFRKGLEITASMVRE